MSFISVVIPVYGAEATLPVLYDRLRSVLDTLGKDFEIVLVDDRSADRSWAVIQDIAARDSRVKGLRLSRNFGQHHAITAGIDACRGEWVVVMDCDLQDAPEDIPRLYGKALEGYDVVLGRREWSGEHAFRRMVSRVFYRMFAYLTDTKWDSRVGVYRIMSKEVVTELRTMREQLRFLSGLVEWMGFPTASIDVQRGERHDGRSHYTVRKLLRLGGGAIVAHSDKPLRLAMAFGFAISAMAMAFMGFIVWRALRHGNPITGWSSLMAVTLFLGGVLISLAGVLGVYLGKVFDEVKGRPLYIVRERANL